MENFKTQKHSFKQKQFCLKLFELSYKDRNLKKTVVFCP